jgi:radical SAM-linked protein
MKLRLRLSKEKQARFISHLDYIRTIERALRRANLPVAWTEGFNPHIKLSLFSALSLGVASRGEYADVYMVSPVFPQASQAALNAVLPEGVRVLAAALYEPGPAPILAGAAYEITVPATRPEQAVAAAAAYNDLADFPWQKSAPPGKPAKFLNLKEYVPFIDCRPQDGGAWLSFDCAVKPAGSVKASQVLAALQERFSPGFYLPAADIMRTDLFQSGGRPLIDG